MVTTLSPLMVLLSNFNILELCGCSIAEMTRTDRNKPVQFWDRLYRYMMEFRNSERKCAQPCPLPAPTLLCCKTGRRDGGKIDRRKKPATRPGRRGGSSSKLSRLHVSGSIQITFRKWEISLHSHIMVIRRKVTYLLESLGPLPRSVESPQNNVAVSSDHDSPFLPYT